jgi:DNA-binding GntR family transcriptional regulator
LTSSRPAPGEEVFTALARLELPSASQAPSRGNMPEAVAGALRQAILDGALAPGSWLREAEVARELKVSRTPVRDAFRILATEGLLNINTNQGAVVSPMTTEDVIELYVMREVLEGLASRLAARRAARRCLDEFAVLIPEMKRVGAAGDFSGLSGLNFKFHEIVRDAAGNRYLDRSLAQIQNAARRFPDPTLGLPGRVKESIEEHVALADAISRGDAPAAEQLAVDHMRHLSELRIQMLLRS